MAKYHWDAWHVYSQSNIKEDTATPKLDPVTAIEALNKYYFISEQHSNFAIVASDLINKIIQSRRQLVTDSEKPEKLTFQDVKDIQKKLCLVLNLVLELRTSVLKIIFIN